MSFWFIINFLIIIYAIISFIIGYKTLALLFGLLALFFFMFNWTRHAMFASIRANIPRKRKVKLAQYSKKAMPFHKWTGTIAVIIALIHGIMMIKTYGFQMTSYKMMFGFMALVIMLLVVLSGWWRQMRTTARKRLIHLSLAFTLLYLIVIHILL